MGGSINVAVRFKNGETVCQDRWTNNMPGWFKHPKMFAGDEDHVRDYVFGMIRNNDKISDPDTLGQPAKVENSSYGLVVWDYVTGSILDNNGYSSPVTWDSVYTGGDMRDENFIECANAGIIFMEVFSYPPRDAKGNLDRTQIKRQRTHNLPAAEALKLGQDAWEQTFGRGSDGKRNKRNPNDWREHIRFGIDTSPMTYYEFPEGQFKDYRAKLIELGFPMTQKEGLNKTLKEFWKKQRVVFDGGAQESHARALYQEFKHLEEGKPFDGVPFEDLTPESQQKFMDSAIGMMGDPTLMAQFNIAKLLGASSRVVTISVGS